MEPLTNTSLVVERARLHRFVAQSMQRLVENALKQFALCTGRAAAALGATPPPERAMLPRMHFVLLLARRVQAQRAILRDLLLTFVETHARALFIASAAIREDARRLVNSKSNADASESTDALTRIALQLESICSHRIQVIVDELHSYFLHVRAARNKATHAHHGARNPLPSASAYAKLVPAALMKGGSTLSSVLATQFTARHDTAVLESMRPSHALPPLASFLPESWANATTSAVSATTTEVVVGGLSIPKNPAFPIALDRLSTAYAVPNHFISTTMLAHPLTSRVVTSPNTGFIANRMAAIMSTLLADDAPPAAHADPEQLETACIDQVLAHCFGTYAPIATAVGLSSITQSAAVRLFGMPPLMPIGGTSASRSTQLLVAPSGSQVRRAGGAPSSAGASGQATSSSGSTPARPAQLGAAPGAAPTGTTATAARARGVAAQPAASAAAGGAANAPAARATVSLQPSRFFRERRYTQRSAHFAALLLVRALNDSMRDYAILNNVPELSTDAGRLAVVRAFLAFSGLPLAAVELLNQSAADFDKVAAEFSAASTGIVDDFQMLRWRRAQLPTALITLLRTIALTAHRLTVAEKGSVVPDQTFTELCTRVPLQAHDPLLTARVLFQIAPDGICVLQVEAGAPLLATDLSDRLDMRLHRLSYNFAYQPTPKCRLVTAAADTPCCLNFRPMLPMIQCTHCGAWVHWACTGLPDHYMSSYEPMEVSASVPGYTRPLRRRFRCAQCSAMPCAVALEEHVAAMSVAADLAVARALVGLTFANQLRLAAGDGIPHIAAAADVLPKVLQRVCAQSGSTPGTGGASVDAPAVTEAAGASSPPDPHLEALITQLRAVGGVDVPAVCTPAQVGTEGCVPLMQAGALLLAVARLSHLLHRATPALRAAMAGETPAAARNGAGVAPTQQPTTLVTSACDSSASWAAVSAVDSLVIESNKELLHAAPSLVLEPTGSGSVTTTVDVALIDTLASAPRVVLQPGGGAAMGGLAQLGGMAGGADEG
ncbi:hypothetical protein EON68_00265, partial [archaeon]